MKIFTLSMLFVFAAFLTRAQDVVPNGGFESWASPGGIPNPTGWSSANIYTGPSVLATTQDSATVHSGNYSVKLNTKSVGSYIVPGVVTTGFIDVNSFSIKGGTAINSRPLTLVGWYQYTPNNDTANININLLNADSQVLGSGTLDISAATSGWTMFEIPITYDSASTPVLSQISITSSAYHGTVGSVMYVDDINYSYYPAGIKEAEKSVVAVYPNPANNQFTIDNREIKAKTLNVYSVDGKMVQAFSLNDGVNMLDASGLSAGFYVIRANGNAGLTYTNSLVIEK